MDSHRRTAALRRALANTIRDFYHRDARIRSPTGAFIVTRSAWSPVWAPMRVCQSRGVTPIQHAADARMLHNILHTVCAPMRVFIATLHTPSALRCASSSWCAL